MRWFRSQRRFGGWAALFALSLQLALSFGHVHVGTTATPSVLAALTSQADSDGTPSHRGSHHPADDLCAICVVSGLIGSAQTSTPPALVPPTAVATALLAFVPDTTDAGQRRVAFRSRAPPQA